MCVLAPVEAILDMYQNIHQSRQRGLTVSVLMYRTFIGWMIIFKMTVKPEQAKTQLITVTIFHWNRWKPLDIQASTNSVFQQHLSLAPWNQQEDWTAHVFVLCQSYFFHYGYLLTCRFSIIPEQVPRSCVVVIQGNYKSHWILAAVEGDFLSYTYNKYLNCLNTPSVFLLRMWHSAGLHYFENCLGCFSFSCNQIKIGNKFINKPAIHHWTVIPNIEVKMSNTMGCSWFMDWKSSAQSWGWGGI